MKKIVVLSGVNLTVAGPLSIIQDAAESFYEAFKNEHQLILLVHSKELFPNFLNKPNIIVQEYKWVRRSLLFRIFFEWVYSYYLSKKIKPYAWVAMQDVTSLVKAKKQFVYCHNATPFYKISKQEIQFEKKFYLYTKIYKYIYGINIKRNTGVIVQQKWMQEKFQEEFKLNNVFIARPNFKNVNETFSVKKNDSFTFFYPSFPRPFKNFELVCKASNLLYKNNIKHTLIITLDGSENKYASFIKKEYGHIPSIQFIGQQTRTNTIKLIASSDCILFASKLESWGLPLTEAAFFNKPILAADLPYASETLNNYQKCAFFDIEDAVELSKKMALAIESKLTFTQPKIDYSNTQTFLSWNQLFNWILTD